MSFNGVRDLECPGTIFSEGRWTPRTRQQKQRWSEVSTSMRSRSLVDGQQLYFSQPNALFLWINRNRVDHSAKNMSRRRFEVVWVNRPSSEKACAGARIQPMWGASSRTVAAAGVVYLRPVIIYANRGDFAQHGLPIYKKLVVRPSDAAKFCKKKKP